MTTLSGKIAPRTYAPPLPWKRKNSSHVHAKSERLLSCLLQRPGGGGFAKPGWGAVSAPSSAPRPDGGRRRDGHRPSCPRAEQRCRDAPRPRHAAGGTLCPEDKACAESRHESPWPRGEVGAPGKPSGDPAQHSVPARGSRARSWQRGPRAFEISSLACGHGNGLPNGPSDHV